MSFVSGKLWSSQNLMLKGIVYPKMQGVKIQIAFGHLKHTY